MGSFFGVLLGLYQIINGVIKIALWSPTVVDLAIGVTTARQVMANLVVHVCH